MHKHAIRPGRRLRLFIIFATTLFLVMPPQVLATPPVEVVPDTTENSCYDQCPPCDAASPGRDEPSPAQSSYPVAFKNGAVRESAVDLSLPGPTFGWSQSRSYDSKIIDASTTHLGRNWISGNGDIRLAEAGGGDLYLLASASAKRTFSESGGSYTGPAGSDLTLEASGDTLVLTHITTGDIHIFHNFSQGVKSGRLAERTTREWQTAGRTGMTYAYDTYGRLETITTAGDQAELISFQYVTDPGWKLRRVQVGGDPYMEVEYTYGSDDDTDPDCGDEDDLVQVVVRKKGTDGSWIERYTQYRYFTDEINDGKLKSVLESDAIQRMIDFYDDIDTPADILNSADDHVGSGAIELRTRVSRSFTYYEYDEDTAVPTDYENTYDGVAVDETGWVASETIYGGCASCGGGSGAGLTMEYRYLNGKYYASFDPENLTSDPTSPGHINIVYRLVIEDVKSGGTLLRRNIYGLSENGYLLRKATMQTTGGTTYWCTSDKLRNDHRILERRMPSAHVSTNSSAELKTFLNPYNGTTTYDNTLDDGLIYIYDYNSAGWETDAWVKKGPSGTAYYVSARDYGDGMSAATWDVVATYEYPTQTATRGAGIATTYDYIYWEGSQKQTITTTRTAVPTSQNGSTVPVVTKEYFDFVGRLRWTNDGEGNTNYYSYHPYTGELAYVMVDVETDDLPSEIEDGSGGQWLEWDDGSSGDTIPSGFENEDDDNAQLVTIREFDNQGRLRKTTDPGGKLDYISYQNNYVARYPYWDQSNTESLLPIEVTVLDNGGVATESLALVGDSEIVSLDGSEPIGIGSLDQSEYTAWTRFFHNLASGQLVKTLSYHFIPAMGNGSHITNYYVTAFAYDAFGRRITTVETSTASVHQVTRTVYDFLDRPISTERKALSSGVDTDADHDLGTLSYTGIEEVASTVYDAGIVGDGHVTSTRSYYGTGGSDYVETLFKWTYRGHLRGIERNNGGTAFNPRSVMDVDWMGRTTGSALYTASVTWANVLTGDGYTDFLSGNSTARNEWTKTSYDKLNRVYRTERYPGTEATNYFQVNNYYDRNSQLVATGDKYSAHMEYAFDGAGRQYQQRTVMALESPDGTYGQYASGGGFNYVEPAPTPTLASMDTTGDDGLIEFTHTVYDTPSGNAIEQHAFELNHTDTNGIDIDANNSYVRRSVFSWYDDADRLSAVADYGSGNGDSSPATWAYSGVLSRPGELDWDDDIVFDGYALLTKYGYDDAGRMDAVISGVSKNGSDTKHVTSKTFFDALGRRLAVAENWVNAEADGTDAGGGTNNEEDRVTKFEYNGLGQQTKLTAVNVTGGGTVNQATKYLYEDPFDASLVTNTIYPDSSDTDSTGTDQVELEYNLDGSLKKKTDQRDVVIEYGYGTTRRQLETEKATNIPAGVYGGNSETDAMRMIVYTYDDLGRPIHILPTNSTAGGTLLNHVQYTYSSLGNVTQSDQDHTDAVGTGASHQTVQYAYDDSDSSDIYDDGLRPTKVTYPSGRIIHSTYGSSNSIADRLGSVAMLEADSSGSPGTDLVQYSYNGTSRLAVTDYAVPDVKLDLYQGTPGTYAGYDRFGRTVRQEWDKYNTGAGVRDRFDYTYDYASNRLSRDIPSSLYGTDNFDQAYTYDGLQRLKNYQQGTQSGGTITSNRNQEQDWTLDQLGNWPTFKERDTDTGGTWDLNQSRSHNAANELTEIASSSTQVGEDLAGNMTKVPKPTSWSAHFDLKYDAWGRLIEVKDGSDTVQKNEYDGLGRRVVRIVYASGSPTHSIHYYYNENWQLLEERKEVSSTIDSDPLNQYIWHPNYIDALALRYYDDNVDGSGIVDYYYLHDANFNVATVTNSSGAVQERYKYTPYGAVTVLNDNFSLDSSGDDGLTDIGSTHFYTGRELDPETGLQLNRHRFYANHLGRWITRDPMGNKAGLNLYAYTESNPTNSVDSQGLVDQLLLWEMDPGLPPPNPPIVPGGDPNNNCYNYACDRMYPSNPKFWQVGSTLGYSGVPSDCEKLRKRIIEEQHALELIFLWRPDCPKGYHKIRLWLRPTGPRPDYHFYRQDPVTREWSDKPGPCKVRAKLTRAWEYKSDYQCCGDLCVPN